MCCTKLLWVVMVTVTHESTYSTDKQCIVSAQCPQCTLVYTQLPLLFNRTGIGRANQVTILGSTTESGDYGPTSDPVSFLDSPVLVTGALLLTNGECSLASPFRINISSEDDTGE